MTITLIANRSAHRLGVAGRGDLASRLHDIAAEVGANVVETSSLDDLAAAADALARTAESDDAVVLAGGDGSYMAGVTALWRAFGDRPLPVIALAPGGTVSTVLHNWASHRSARRDPADYTRRLLRALARRTATPVPRPTLRVREASGRERVGFIFGAGLVSRFFEIYEREGADGEGGAARIVARIFAGSLFGRSFARQVLEPVPCVLEIDGERAPLDRTSLVAASVVRDLGLHMRLLYRAAERHDRFHAVATALGPSLLGPQMPLVLLGRPLRGPKVDALTRHLALRFTEGGGAYVLDGDLFRSDAVEIFPGPILDVVSV